MKTNTFLPKPWLWITLLSVFVCFRTLPFFLYPGIHFDSDQATFGLMAIHLAKLQALPIFMYGQKYMLGLQSYLAAPFFVFGRASILTIKIPELAVNLLTCWVLFFILVKKLGLRPVLAFFATLPLALPTIALSAQWMNASGGHVEPILLVLILYLVRERMISFAVISALSMLHREWMLAPIIALWGMIYFENREDPGNHKKLREDLMLWLPIFFGLIIGVEIYAYFRSPNYLGSRTPFKFNHGYDNYLESFRWIKNHLDVLLGLNSETIGTLPISFSAGSLIEGTAISILFLLAISTVRPTRAKIIQNSQAFYFASYLFFSFLISATFYALKLQGHDAMLIRYLLLAAYLPTAFLIYAYAFFQNKRTVQFVSALALIIAAFHFSDHVRYWQALKSANPVDTNGALAQFLTDHHVQYAIAPYWRAYDITFRTQEKIIVASSQLVRIPAYQARYELHTHASVESVGAVARIDDRNCSDGSITVIAQVPVCLVGISTLPQ